MIVGRLGQVDVLELSLRNDRTVQVATVGPDDGDAVLYFHSPSTSGEELNAAVPAATKLGFRILAVRRPSIQGEEADRFVSDVADDVVSVVERLAVPLSAVFGWSGGAPYALAAAARLGTEAASVSLVSPVPGALTGPDAVPGQSARLREVANTTSTSSWVTGPSALRDYRAVVAPWTFDLSSITQPVTIWAPEDDEIVPPHLADHLATKLPNCTVVHVPGGHDWFVINWETVLERLRT